MRSNAVLDILSLFDMGNLVSYLNNFYFEYLYGILWDLTSGMSLQPVIFNH